MAFYLIIIGSYLYYSKSKYFPNNLFRLKNAWLGWVGTILILLGTVFYVKSDGWVSGLLIVVFAIPLALLLVQFFAVLGKRYFYSFALLVHIFLILTISIDAC